MGFFDKGAPSFAPPLTTTPLPPLQSALETEDRGCREIALARDQEAEDPILASLFRQADASPPRVVLPGRRPSDGDLVGAAALDEEAGVSPPPPAAAAAACDAAMLARLAAWRAAHGTSHVPRRVHDAADLGEWLWRQRRARRRGDLPAWLTQGLDALAVDWRPAAEASLWHADYHAARRARAVAVATAEAAPQTADDGDEGRELAGGWRAARAFASAGADVAGGAFDPPRPPGHDQRQRGDPAPAPPIADPLHASAAAWLRRQGALMLASSPGLAPRDGAAATAAERRGMLRRLGAGLEARAPRSAVADAAAMAGLNAHERKLERRRRREAERAREGRRAAAAAAVEAAAERAARGVRAEEARREALRFR